LDLETIDKKSNLSLKILSDITTYSKYAKYLEDIKRRETWENTVTRNMHMHIQKFPNLEDEIVNAFRFVLDKQVLPSMRALEDSTPIRTLFGWKTAATIIKDDILFDSNGKETVVKDVIKFKDKELWTLKFSDGSKLTACDEHLWIISTKDDRLVGKSRVVDTKFIRNHLKQGGVNNISIANPLPLEFNPSESMSVLPYLLGHWLGDGYSSGYQISCSVEDSEFISKEYINAGYPCKQSTSSNIWTWSVKGFAKDLRAHDLINNKHIPYEYLNGTFQQRLALLQGLMDSDGCISKEGRCSFSNTNEILIDNVQELISSLGIKHTTNLTKPKEYTNHLPIYEIKFTTTLPVARLPRKLERIRTDELKQTEHRKIVDVIYYGKGDATCFHVDSDDRSFLAGKEMIVTHNSLQFGGKPIEISPNRLYNCSYLACDDSAAFSETMFLLLGGSGVGYSVQKHHVDKLPEIMGPKKRTRRYLIGDSIEGWADSIKVLVESYFFNKSNLMFDYRDIRPKGARLITSGGKAPGPQPLKDCIYNIRKVFDNAKVERGMGCQLTTLEVHDIMCYIADAVLAGGIRRAALIALFSFDDSTMLTSKFGNWWEINPQRARANNSAVILRNKIKEKQFRKFWEKIEASGSGDPGIYFTNDKDYGCNPCCEIALKSQQFCNLTTTNVSNITSQDDLNARVKAASFIGTLQASYTEFHYLRDQWQKNAEESPLLGVSMTGIGSGAILGYDLEEAATVAVNENKRAAELMGIKPALRVTCVKPEGTASCVLGTSSGIHAWHWKHFIRSLRLGKNEPMYNYLKKAIPDLVEDDVLKPDVQAVVRIPIKAPQQAILRTESAIDLLNRGKLFHEKWVKPGHIDGQNTHNVSITVSIKDDEWESVGNWMWDNRDSYNGIAVFPFNGGTHVQAPFEDCDEETYESMLQSVRKIDLTKVQEDEDLTAHKENLACSGGACTITHL